MKNILTITSTLLLGAALSLSACGKDKKPATTDPGAPVATDPAKPADPAAAGDTKPAATTGDAKPAGGGW